jgi:hypothetical protein
LKSIGKLCWDKDRKRGERKSLTVEEGERGAGEGLREEGSIRRGKRITLFWIRGRKGLRSRRRIMGRGEY